MKKLSKIFFWEFWHGLKRCDGKSNKGKELEILNCVGLKEGLEDELSR